MFKSYLNIIYITLLALKSTAYYDGSYGASPDLHTAVTRTLYQA
jgi:hypothetical protein